MRHMFSRAEISTSAGTKCRSINESRLHVCVCVLYPVFEFPAAQWHVARDEWRNRGLAQYGETVSAVCVSCAIAAANYGKSSVVLSIFRRPFSSTLSLRWRMRRFRLARSRPRPWKRSTRFMTRTTSDGSPGGSRLRGACSRRPPTCLIASSC